jgi:TolB-like protein/Tfp pilus assembly protein PilF
VPDVFLSYSREDQPTARRVAEALQREGFSVWWDQTLATGEAYDQVTEEALEKARAVVVLWSKASVASRWVRAEATTADRNHTLMPVVIEPCRRPIMFELTQTADLSQWKGDASDLAWRAFIADVRKFIDRGDGASSSTATISVPVRGSAAGMDQATPVAARHVGRAPLVAAVAIALVLGAGLIWSLLDRGRHGAASTSPDIAQSAASEVSLAVLPFANLSSDPEQEYFSDGLTEEILNQLAQVRELRLVGRTSSFAFKGRNEDLRVIGEKLGVGNLLEGSVRKDGSRLRITTQLIRSDDGSHLWSKAYDREIKDVFAVQDEIARDVATALRVTLDVGSLSRAKGGTANLEAYDRYLRARQLFGQGGGLEDLQQAAQLLREAVAIDPQFSRAWFLLVGVLNGIRSWLPFAETGPVAREQAEALARAAAVSPDSWAAQVGGVIRLAQQRQWGKAEELATSLMVAEPLNSDNLEKISGMLNVYFATGRLEEGIRLLEQAMRIEPLSLSLSTDLQRWLYSSGRYAESQAEHRRSKTLTGNHQRSIGRALLLLLVQEDADPKDIQAVISQMLEDPNQPAQFLNELSAAAGDRQASRAVLRKALAATGDQDMTRRILLYMMADALGDRELALDALDDLTPVDSTALWLAPHSGLRSDPRFKAHVRAAGLEQYWRSSGHWADSCRPLGDDDFECK